MPEDRQNRRTSSRAKLLYFLTALIALLIASLVIESCDSEKIEICDTATGECHLESSCRPLLFDLLT